MLMSDRLDDFEKQLNEKRCQIVEWFLTKIMNLAIWAISKFKERTDLEALLRIKTYSDKIEAELASELMIRNRHRKQTVT